MPLLTPEQAAQELSISTAQLRAVTNKGHIRYVNIGLGEKRESRRYALEDLTEFIERRSRRECRSTSAPASRSTVTTSYIDASDFLARLDARRNAKQKKSKSQQTRP